ncbi:MAG: membrane fusion protein (multidrug efflux system) [Alphaproteobacteria bacterium]
MLPPQNTSGNWVKVVQRIPLRLDVVQKTTDPPLRAGMSVVVEIDTLHERKTPDFITNTLALIYGDE